MSIQIDLDQSSIAGFCKKHHIRRLAFFGSVTREDFRPSSDVDVLVEFETGHTPGLALFEMQLELSEMIGREVELSTPNFLSPYFRDQVQTEAQVVYDKAG